MPPSPCMPQPPPAAPSARAADRGRVSPAARLAMPALLALAGLLAWPASASGAGPEAAQVDGARRASALEGRAALDEGGLALRWRLPAPPVRGPGALRAPASDASAPSAPSAPAQGAWQRVDLPGASCGRGAPFAYYLNASADEEAGIVLLLSGGGACMKDGPPPEGATGVAAQLHCMAFSNWEDPVFTDLTIQLIGLAVPYLSRIGDNPLAGWHFAVLPYCTGDVHAGRMTEPYDYDPSPDGDFLVTQRGHLNLLAVLDDLQSRFPEPETPVLLTGLSAGGFGAIFNYPEVIGRWPNTTLLPDAGIAPGHPDSLLVREGERIAARWDAQALLPPYCRAPRCVQDTLHLLRAHALHQDGDGAPWRPFGYLQGQRDEVLRDYLELSTCGYEVALRGGAGEARAADNLRAWLPDTAEHVFSFRRAAETEGGVGWWPFFQAVATATGPADLPPDAVDPWQRCNDLTLPMLVAR